MNHSFEHTVTPLGFITSPFKQKFGIPRQPGLAGAKGQVHFDATFNSDFFVGLEQYTHLWLLFLFHETLERGFKPKVKAPRLGGNQTTGVFATRSTHRPNGIGMSVVKNEGVRTTPQGQVLDVSGIDLLDQTPIIDIKPYLPYADSIPSADVVWHHNAQIPHETVRFSVAAESQLTLLQPRYPDLGPLIRQVLAQDPRPAYKRKKVQDDKLYAIALYDFDVQWCKHSWGIEVIEIQAQESGL